MSNRIIPGLIAYLILLMSLSVHEWAHGYAADKLGDPTPRLSGRLTLNPLAHIDIVGTVIIPLAMLLFASHFVLLGWAKPVPINPRYFKKNGRLCELAVSLTGPFSNLILAVLTATIGVGLAKFFGGSFSSLFATMAWLNVCLFTFNLIPLPPLDGGYVLKTVFWISDEIFFQISKFGFWILLVLINIQAFCMIMFMCSMRIFALVNCLACAIFGVPCGALLQL